MRGPCESHERCIEVIFAIYEAKRRTKSEATSKRRLLCKTPLHDTVMWLAILCRSPMHVAILLQLQPEVRVGGALRYN